MLRNLAGAVMIEIAAAGAALQRAHHGACIGLKGHIEYREFVAACRLDTLHQRDVALHPGDEHACARLFEPELLQRTDAVGVAVEDVIELHGR